ncbi:MAG: ABC transporter permease [Gammaproteobacteria bacterium]
MVSSIRLQLKIVPLLWGNLNRRRLRSGLTLLSIIIGFALFGILGAVLQGFTTGITNGSAELVVFNRNSRFHGLPISYQDSIESIHGVQKVGYMQWFGGYYQDPRNQLAGFAVSPNYPGIDPTITLPSRQIAQWDQDKTGVIVGASTASRYGWKLGESIPVLNTYGVKSWTFIVDGIAHSTIPGRPSDGFFLHYDYLNQSSPLSVQNTVSAFLVGITDADHAARLSSEIDNRFANSSAPTRTNTAQAVAQGFSDQFANLGEIVLIVAGAVFLSLLLITCNVHAQSVRERTSEWATLRTFGFTNRNIFAIVVAEAMLITLVGSVIGLGIARLLVPLLAHEVEMVLPGFLLPLQAIGLGLVIAAFIAVATSIVPLIQVAGIRPAVALRRA